MNTYYILYKYIYDVRCIVKLDAPEPWGLFYQDNFYPQIEGLEELHNNAMYYLSIILFTVSWIIITTILSYKLRKRPQFSRWIEEQDMLKSGPALRLVITLIVIFIFEAFVYIHCEGQAPLDEWTIDTEEELWTSQYFDNSDNETLIMFSDNAPSNPMPPQGNIPGGNFPGNNLPGGNIVIRDIVLSPPNYAADYIIDTKYWYLKVDFNNHVYGTVSHDPFKNIDSQLFHVGNRITFQARPGNFTSFSPVKTLPADVGLLERTINTQSTELTARISNHNYTTTKYHYNKTTEHRRVNNLPGWGVDNTIAALERDWERYDHTGFNIIKKVRELRVHESLYRHFNPQFRSQVSKQFFEVD